MFKSDKVKKALVDISKGIKIDKEKFLLGTIEICLETYEEIINLTNGLLKRNNYFWNTEEKELISMALVTFAINDYGGGRFWSEFAEKLRYDTSEVTRIGKEVFENFCISNNLYFHVGNKNKGYVTSILCHAIIPNSNLPRFFDFLQDLYFKDLEEDYIDQEVEELIQYMQKLFTKYIEDDDISLVVQGSKMTIANQQLPKAFRLAFVKSPQKVATILERLLLYINQRNYGQMVEYLEQDRFDIFFDHHRFEMNGKVGPNKWGGKSQSSKKFITAQYYIENEEIYLQLPRQIIDSDYINHNIYLQISFGSQVIHEQELTLTKSRLLFKTEQELVKLPSFNTEISYKIIAGPNTIHASKGSLNREFIIFDHEGNEVNPRKLTDETIKVVTPYDSEVLTDDAETIVLKYGTYRITTVFLNQESLIIINNKVLSPNVASLKTEVEDKYRYPGIVIEESTKQYSVYSKIPTIKLRMPYGKSTEDYIITLNENNYSLNNICHEKINNIPDGSGESLAQIEIKEKFILAINPIQITIREKGTNRIHIEDNIFILQSLRYEFDKKYYYKEDEAILTGLYADDINLAEKVNDSTKINLRKNKSYKTQILHKNNRYWLTIEIPILYWKFDNVKSDMKTSRYIWHEDVETYNLFINYPSDIKPPGLHVITESSIEVIQGKFTREGYKYSLEYLFKVTNQGPISLGVIIDGNQEAITEIHFNPVIKNLSVAYYDNNSLINGLVASWSFLGSGELSADIVYSETSKVIKNYKLKKGQQILDKKIELFYGEHEIKLYQVQEDDFFVGSEVRTDLAQQEFIVGDPIIVKTKSKILKCKKCLCEDIEYDVQNFYLKDLRFSSKWGHYVATGYYLKRDKYTGQERIWYFTKHNPFELRLLNQEDNQYIFEIVDKDQDGLIYDKQTTNINPVYEDGDVSRFKLIDEVVLEIIE